ncbi:hypothetical protein ACHAXS_011729 [Conticribra weissflogii]
MSTTSTYNFTVHRRTFSCFRVSIIGPDCVAKQSRWLQHDDTKKCSTQFRSTKNQTRISVPVYIFTSVPWVSMNSS